MRARSLGTRNGARKSEGRCDLTLCAVPRCLCCSFVSAEMSKIHTRMPVILSPSDAQRWVDVDRYSWKEAKTLCKPFEGLGLYAVPAVVNNARNHGVEV